MSISNTSNSDMVSFTVNFDNSDLELLKGTSVSSYIIKNHYNHVMRVNVEFVYLIDDTYNIYLLNDDKTDYDRHSITIDFYDMSNKSYYISGDVYAGSLIVKLGE